MFVVDNDAAVRNSLKFSLEMDGLVVRTFSSGDELLRGANLVACQCFIVAQEMPRMQGLQVIAALRSHGVDGPAILLSSHVTPALDQLALAAGIKVVEKPLLGNALTESIQAALAARPG